MSDNPVDPVCSSTPLGLTKIPDPMIDPTITVIPLSNVNCFLRFTGSWKLLFPPPDSSLAVNGINKLECLLPAAADIFVFNAPARPLNVMQRLCNNGTFEQKMLGKLS